PICRNSSARRGEFEARKIINLESWETQLERVFFTLTEFPGIITQKPEARLNRGLIGGKVDPFYSR
ncbi:MAG: hypothetical protein O6703_03095, partial [Gammaproteobacteria bacterium]|nr:hypothetical protein [Gammaproteobacteria bacterium]